MTCSLLSGPVECVDVGGGRPVEAVQGPGQRPLVVLVQRVPETPAAGGEDELRQREVQVLEGRSGRRWADDPHGPERFRDRARTQQSLLRRPMRSAAIMVRTRRLS
jgi:hypothetical protein